MRTSMADPLRFHNLTEQGLAPADVLDRMLRFAAQDPRAAYDLVIGSDSQVHRGHTKLVTGIILHRRGRGAWACCRTVVLPRELTSVKEKLSLETSLSQEAAWCLEELQAVEKLEDLLLPYVYQGASLRTFIDIDAGTHPAKNKTSLYLPEMVERVKAMGRYAVRVKPDSYGASAYANRYTKSPGRAASG
ncbi:ribonuclease H-like YkuK family protein [Paenibacillus caseinilyticus]|uniref:ribonuclease H-like YkuK family protein n=1 Tax=Paenibacillus caseinilyticus TaxID=3098138 RepID=UPI0022B91514|nr:ribonuclease H-like YkuK family protein [Paenibacillus caseinilyticus]